MSLSVGIVGLPNVGKSTLFNALLKKQQAYVANFPFATIEPNIGVVPVPDSRLEYLAETIASPNNKLQITNYKQIQNSNYQFQNRGKWPPIVPATVEFVDIAGLIAGASKGEGLGNKFLSHIRDTSAICHVLRVFSDPDIIKQGITDPKSDLEIVETELALADIQTLEKQSDPGNSPDKDLKKRWEIIQKFKKALESATMIRIIVASDEEEKLAKELGLLTAKPVMVVLNVDENDLKEAGRIEKEYAEKMKLNPDQVVAICAKTESELAGLSEEDQRAYLEDLGVKNSGLERLIQKAFSTLGLLTFLTAGEKEVRAWTIRKEATALEAAGEIHTDFMNKFIKADVVSFEEFIESGGWKNARELGRVKSEGRDYVMCDGDVVEFKIGT
jgi:ribosome-binding ATPase